MIGAVAPVAVVERFSWFPRLALIGYAAMTIAGYLVMGPYFTLGFIAKGIEVALIALLVVDVIRVYGSPMGLVRSALASSARSSRSASARRPPSHPPPPSGGPGTPGPPSCGRLPDSDCCRSRRRPLARICALVVRYATRLTW